MSLCTKIQQLSEIASVILRKLQDLSCKCHKKVIQSSCGCHGKSLYLIRTFFVLNAGQQMLWQRLYAGLISARRNLIGKQFSRLLAPYYWLAHP